MTHSEATAAYLFELDRDIDARSGNATAALKAAAQAGGRVLELQ